TRTDIDDGHKVDDAPAFEPGALVGRYIIIGRLGAGGMGVVYAAYDPTLDRRIALKVVHPARRAASRGRDSENDPAQLRLVREAQAMARLAHPNVVAVHDVGTLGDAVFIAMEFIDGETLGSWLRAAPRTTSEVLAVFCEAGRGLAAAHAAGIVHRDFKPENVLVGRTGRVAVADFGLARVHDDSVAKQPASPEEALEDTAAPKPARADLTRPGERMGTPTYMAPEQYLGRPTDARTDQFSFCVALYEALYGRRPFAGSDVDDLAVRVTTGNITPPPRDARVSPRIAQAIVRALKPNPAERFTAMSDLLSALEHRTVWKRPAFVVTVAAFVALGVGAVVVDRIHASRDEACAGTERVEDGVWGSAERAAIEAAFRATGAPGADEAWRAVLRGVAAYVSALGAARKEACEATRVRGEQSEELLDLRVQCIADLRERLGALTALFAKADSAMVGKAADAVSELPSVRACADAEALKTGVRLPKDEATRTKVAKLRKELNNVDARFLAGKLSTAKTMAVRALGKADKLGYEPVRAEAFALLATVMTREGSFKPAEEFLMRAIVAAESSRHDRVAAKAWATLVHVVGFEQGRIDEGLRLARFAEAAALRLGRPDDELEARLANSLNSIHQARGDFEKARAFAEKAAAAAERAFGSDYRRAMPYRINLAMVLAQSGQGADAQERLRQALAVAEKELGPNHPDIGDYHLSNLAWFLLRDGKCAEALPVAERAYRISRRAFGDLPGTRHVAQVYGEVLRCVGRPREALSYVEKAKSFFEKLEGGKGVVFARVLFSLAAIHVDLGELEKAHAASERALGLVAETPGDPILEADAKMLHAIVLDRMKQDLSRVANLVAEARGVYARLGKRGESQLKALDSIFGAKGTAKMGSVDAGVRR
ncbi:MAG: serine/threonine protein kinase, partial [Deltaproteobacteria bacterium]|nr:serine/threonine protein kinase [Deltaproteobacteria bacterium]